MKFKCDKCNMNFNLEANLKIHKLSVHQKIKNHKCKSCDEVFKTFQELKFHKNQLHQIKLEKYKNETHLKGEDQNLKCKLCGKTFPYMIKFKSHLKINHNGDGLHNCNKCSSTFFRESTLEKHVKRVHDYLGSEKMLNEDEVACDVCDTTFPELQLLKSHYENHNSAEIQAHEDQNSDNVQDMEEEQEIECDSTTSINRNPNLMCNVCHDYFQDKKRLLNHTGNDHLEETLQYVLTVVLKNQYASSE